MRIIAVAAQKGGTGKTTTAAAIAQGASQRGIKTLCVDLDPQGSLTAIMQGHTNAPGSYELMNGAPAAQLIQDTALGHIIPASLALCRADAEYSTKPARDYLLQDALEPVKKDFPLIVIDTPPDLGTLLINALTAADKVIIPAQADAFAIPSIYQLAETIAQVKRHCNRGLTVAGILPTRYSGRTVLTRDTLEAIKEKAAALGYPVFATPIREGIAVKEAQTLRENLFKYAPRSNPARDYAALLDDLGIEKGEEL